VVRCIEDNYQPLVERQPEGYSLPLLHAIDCALAMKPGDRPQTIDAFAALIDLPVSDVEAVVNSFPVPGEPPAALMEEPVEAAPPVVMAMNHAAASAEPVTPRTTRRLSPALLALAAVAVLATGAAVWLANRHNAAPEAANSSAVVAQAPASAPSAATVPAALATVYLKLESGESVVLNGQPVEVKPGSSGFAALNLAAGQYKIDIYNGSVTHSQSLTIDKPGTWLINPGN